MKRWSIAGLALLAVVCVLAVPCQAGSLKAGVGRAEITDPEALPTNDPLYVKALVIDDGTLPVVLITLDAVAIGELGRVPSTYLSALGEQIERELKIPPARLVVNASHCHGVIRNDVLELTVQAVKQAYNARVPVKLGSGTALEQRISENRRVRLTNGDQADMRRAYALPADSEVVSVGPIDPEIGLLRIDRLTGQPLAAVYQFACHPIEGVPTGGNTADYPGFASRVIEENLGEGVIAFFLQGCGGDINPARYKDATHPRDAEPLGNLLGLAALRGLRAIETDAGASLNLISATLSLPRAVDYERRIIAIEAEQKRLMRELRPTNINFKAFLPLLIQHRLSPEYPGAESQRYLHEKQSGFEGLAKLDTANRAELEAYLSNIRAMEQLTRLQANYDLLKMHQAQTLAAGSKLLDVSVTGLRIGDFLLVTFPGELTVEVGLKIKKLANRPKTYVSGYTNGYIYYTPTQSQRTNTGYAQEDCDSLIAPEWESLFIEQAVQMIGRL